MATERIGLVIGQLTPGGAERQLALLARQLRASKFEPVVYCMSERIEPFGRHIQEAGLRLRVFGGAPASRVRRLCRELRADEIRLLHSWLYIGNTYAWLANMASGRRPLITSARNCKKQGFLHTAVNRRAFRASHRVVANSHQVALYAHRHYGAPIEKIAVVYNGIDTEHFRPRAERQPGAPRIVGIGRLVPQKDPLLFVEVASRLVGRWPQARFTFFGEGPMRAEIEAVIASLGLGDNLSLPGNTREVADHLASADLFLLTSAWEGLPNVVLEAMACGVPCIGTDVGGTSELIRSGTDGFLVEYRDAEAMAHYAGQLLLDETRRRAMAGSARRRACQFAGAHMVKAMLGIYEETLAAA